MKIKDLSKYDTIFCDSLEALELAKNYGLPKKSLIKTSSPAVILDGSYNTSQIDEKWDFEKFNSFDESTVNFVADVYKELNQHNDLKDYAHAVARFSYNFHIFLYKASCLNHNDLIDRRLIIDIDHKNRRINPPWQKLLANNKNTDQIVIKTSDKISDDFKAYQIPILSRFRISGLESLVYKIFLSSYSLYPKFLSKGDIFVVSDNELIVETCYELIKQRYRIKKIFPENCINNISNQIFEKIKKVLCDKFVTRYISSYVIDDLVDVCKLSYFEDLRKFLNQYTSLKMGWEMSLKNHSTKSDFIFINAPSSIQGISLYNAKNRNAALVAAQHGVTDEIVSKYKAWVGMEVNTCDIFLTYNDAEVSLSNKSLFRKGKSFTVGMSLRHLRMGQSHFGLKIDFPIVYLAFAYKGNNGSGGNITDFEKAKNEINFIENVLSKLPHKVLYKTYPEGNTRYPDKDPVFNVISKYKNIKLYEKKVDMRYLMSKHQIIITSRATSTLSWPMLSGKPLVFINSNKNSPLNRKAYKLMKKGVFLFDEESPDFYKNIRKLLSLPISEIEDICETMELERNETINTFFTKYRGSAGKRSVKLLENYHNHNILHNTN